MYKYLYKYYPIRDYSINNLINEEVCFNSMNEFNDTLEGKYNVVAKEKGVYNIGELLAERLGKEYSSYIIFNYRVLSLTIGYDFKYMWENYAENGTGFCIEYKYQDLLNISDDVESITYYNRKEPDMYLEEKMNQLDLKERVKKVLFTKEEKWKNEYEVRLTYIIKNKEVELTDIDDYLENNNTSSKYEYTCDFLTKRHFKSPKRIIKKCVPNKIYLGYNIKMENEYKIKQILLNKYYKYEKIKKENLYC